MTTEHTAPDTNVARAARLDCASLSDALDKLGIATARRAADLDQTLGVYRQRYQERD